ncbi:MAG: S8 family peptidase [Actinomycetota bacterium]|nr:S8 family peptidase [Actinomycetota bacterium]
MEGRYVVVFRRGASREDVRSGRDEARRRGGQVHEEYAHALAGFAATLPSPAIDALRRNPKVEYIEPDAVVTASDIQAEATWGLDRIDQRALPLTSTYSYNSTGSGVKAYVIDTGIRSTHLEFGGRVMAGATAFDDGLGAQDCNGHGTHVAATLGGSTHGVAKQVQLVPVRVLDCSGAGRTSGVIAAVDWVTADHQPGQPAVANLSLGGGPSDALDSAVANSISDGVSYAISAGNDNYDACNDSPARVGAAMTVGSTTSSDARSSFSNHGPCLDLFAPGSIISSAWHTADTASATVSGTSMAAPHVAGVAALYLQANPSASASNVHSAIVNTATSNVVSDPGPGSPNRLVYSVTESTPPPPGFGLTNPDFERYDAATRYVYDWQTNFDYTGWGGGYQSKVGSTGSRVHDVLAYTRTDGASIASNSLAVAPGQVFRIQADAAYVGWPGATHPDGFFLRAWFGTSGDFGRWSPGASFVDLVPPDSPMPSDWRTYGGDVTVPSGVTHMRVVLYNWGPQWGANFQFDNVRVSSVG